MRCDKCGYISFEHNLTCPACNVDLSMTRSKLGCYLDPPEIVSFDVYFSGDSGAFRTTTVRTAKPAREAELDLDTSARDASDFNLATEGSGEAELDLDTTADEDFEFTLDD